ALLLRILTKINKIIRPITGQNVVRCSQHLYLTGVIMLTLDATKTALVVIDLQEGILPFAGGPHTADEVVSRAARLAEKCRASGAPVVMVRVGWSADFAEALKQPVDAQAAAQALPANWWNYPVSLGKRDSDIEVTKRQWGAFYGTDLELQLRRRG